MRSAVLSLERGTHRSEPPSQRVSLLLIRREFLRRVVHSRGLNPHVHGVRVHDDGCAEGRKRGGSNLPGRLINLQTPRCTPRAGRQGLPEPHRDLSLEGARRRDTVRAPGVVSAGHRGGVQHEGDVRGRHLLDENSHMCVSLLQTRRASRQHRSAAVQRRPNLLDRGTQLRG